MKCYTTVIGLSHGDAAQLINQVKYAVQRLQYGIHPYDLETMQYRFFHGFMDELSDHNERIDRAGPVMAYAMCIEILGRYILELCTHINPVIGRFVYGNPKIKEGDPCNYFL